MARAVALTIKEQDQCLSQMITFHERAIHRLRHQKTLLAEYVGNEEVDMDQEFESDECYDFGSSDDDESIYSPGISIGDNSDDSYQKFGGKNVKDHLSYPDGSSSTQLNQTVLPTTEREISKRRSKSEASKRISAVARQDEIERKRLSRELQTRAAMVTKKKTKKSAGISKKSKEIGKTTRAVNKKCLSEPKQKKVSWNLSDNVKNFSKCKQKMSL